MSAERLAQPRLNAIPPVLRVGLAAAAAVAVIAFNAAYCYAHGWLLGEPVPGSLAVAWSLKAVLGWLLVAGGLVWLAARGALDRSVLGTKSLWGVGLALPVGLLMSEWGLGRAAAAMGALPEATPLGWLTYQRGPLLMAVALGVGAMAYHLKRSRGWADQSGALTAGSIEVLTGTGKTVVELADVEQFTSFENYVRVCLVDGRRYLLRTTMRNLENTLPPGHFVRIHRQAIIARACVIERRSADSVLLASGAVVRIGRQYRRQATSIGLSRVDRVRE